MGLHILRSEADTSRLTVLPTAEPPLAVGFPALLSGNDEIASFPHYRRVAKDEAATGQPFAPRFWSAALFVGDVCSCAHFPALGSLSVLEREEHDAGQLWAVDGSGFVEWGAVCISVPPRGVELGVGVCACGGFLGLVSG